MPEGELQLTSPLIEVPGIGDRMARDLATMDLRAVGQLLVHLPHRHEVEQPESPIADLQPEHVVTARGEITACRPVGFGTRTRFEAVLHDGSGRLDLVWFNAPYLRGKLHPGMTLRVSGKARRYKSSLQLANPRFEIVDNDTDEHTTTATAVDATPTLRPVYPATERVSSRAIGLAVSRTLPHALPLIDEHLPEEIRVRRDLPVLRDAYRMIHAPADEQEVSRARRRLAYDELLLLQLGVALKRHQLRDTQRAPALRSSEAVHRDILASFPFTLTGAQQRVIGELTTDLTRDVPTNRLIQGDVGSGKTLVALYAMLLAVKSGHQAAMMAPTEILAEQHFDSIQRVLTGGETRIALLTGSASQTERSALLERLAAGDIDVLVGTHALLTESVSFRSLAVAIIDEQHRFGVHQRSGLRSKGGVDHAGVPLVPHVIVMTATPIPRTLSLTLFGDLDVSTIDELPPGRQPVETTLAMPDDRPGVYEQIRARIEAGDQAFVVVPTIDGDEESGLTGVRAVAQQLERTLLPGLRIATVHGRLKRATREHIMERFRRGLIDVLVATTVIEVGVDIPNATAMIVEQADRFGLAQLHQLRGRVGRGTKPSWCCLIADPTTPEGAERLRVMQETADGFRLAERDFELRGPGEIFGARQSGLPPFRVADLVRDTKLLAMARDDAQAWVARSPTLAAPHESIIRRRVLKAHGAWLGLGDVG
ncbi:MAG: ATP-dependent DNA helicase RecG [Phycisphaerales bacterium]